MNTYSKAFDLLATNKNNDIDVQGLLAYALYKQVINEKCRTGGAITPAAQRNLSEGEIQLYRNQSLGLLRDFANIVINEEIKNSIKKANGFWFPGVVSGIVSWILSLIITIIIYASTPFSYIVRTIINIHH